jgi:hypothetical protein
MWRRRSYRGQITNPLSLPPVRRRGGPPSCHTLAHSLALRFPAPRANLWAQPESQLRERDVIVLPDLNLGSSTTLCRPNVGNQRRAARAFAPHGSSRPVRCIEVLGRYECRPSLRSMR